MGYTSKSEVCMILRLIMERSQPQKVKWFSRYARTALYLSNKSY